MQRPMKIIVTDVVSSLTRCGTPEPATRTSRINFLRTQGGSWSSAPMDYDAIGQRPRRRSYDASGLALATNGFGYEPGGELAFITNALGGVTSKSFTARGQLKGQTSPDGSTNGWRFYLDGRLRREI